jgi:8-oxo-dGTP pyrophosphatase MutT (NUDIX family)
VTPEDIRIVPIEALDLRLEPRPWPWAEANRAFIEAHFEKVRRERRVWNGRVLLLHRFAVDGAVLSGAYLETDFADFLAWRDSGFPDRSMRNCVSAAALRTADDAFILGRMGRHTANASRVYFPAGTPDPGDVKPDGTVDLLGNVMRELTEETGLHPDEVSLAGHWRAVFDGPRIVLMRPLRSPETAKQLAVRIRGFVAGQAKPELDDIVVVKSRADFVPDMSDFVRAYIESEWAHEVG